MTIDDFVSRRPAPSRAAGRLPARDLHGENARTVRSAVDGLAEFLPGLLIKAEILAGRDGGRRFAAPGEFGQAASGIAGEGLENPDLAAMAKHDRTGAVAASSARAQP